MLKPMVYKIWDVAITPHLFLNLVENKSQIVLLQTNDQYLEINQYSYICMNPIKIITSMPRDGSEYTLTDIDNILSLHRQNMVPELPPFQCGFAGYLSYDYGLKIENIPINTINDTQIPDFWFGLYDVVLAIDHILGKTYLIYQQFLSTPDACSRRIENIMSLMEQYFLRLDELESEDFILKSQIMNEPILESTISKDDYLNQVCKVKNYIYNGDVFQVNLSQRFIKHAVDSSWLIYIKMFHSNGGPFSAFIDDSENQILCSSPERFIKVDYIDQERQIETRPIKGSRKRGRSFEEDEHFINDLLCSKKDEAELKMIVDLCRNDFGKICVPGSIHVKEHRMIEKYKSVIHTVSIINGLLEKEILIEDIINAVFPGGSITGAPKIRAMEIIEELEDFRRGIYCGSIGFIGLNGNIDLNIAIRTILHKKGVLYYNGGGGIVTDSSPEKEYEETLFKVWAMSRAIT
ncbi:anthranilate synthase component I family protein [Paenibacillus sp. KN14-4R]|uniref:anthranilate synthase component I family protein n=1 Tax=Paenibacillus sp. KN14-4R TaxID=3445773 RepID=UPI003FA15EF8